MPTPEIRDTKPAVDTPITIPSVAPVAPVTPQKPIVPHKPVVAVVTQTREAAISIRLGKIIAEHGGLVSNIPAVKGHEYWQLKAELDALRNATP